MGPVCPDVMPTRKPFLELSGVTLRAGDGLVFRDTHWVFGRDQHWALVGSNGSGKTLLASALSGTIPVVRGELIYGFRPAGRAPEDAVAHVSFEQQKAAAGSAPAASRWFDLEEWETAAVSRFLSRDSVEEINPFEVVERASGSDAGFERRRRRIMRMLGIDALRDRLLPSLSNGEMRKALLARALLRRPRLLILDDPFTGLDQEFRRHLKEILEDLMRQGNVRLLLIVNHSDELPRGITHLLLVDGCRVAASGNLKTMLAHPRVRRLFAGDCPAPVFHRPTRLPAGLAGRGTTALVRLEGVSMRYDGHSILQGIDWTIRRGESWALLGPNGSGKSALLSLIVGDNPQAYGNAVYVFGRLRGSGESVWEIKRRIGWISPELHLHFPETQTCLETVISGFRDSQGCYVRPAPGQVRAARRWLSQFGLSKFAGRSFGSLSSGLQRVVLLARALVKAPELLVLDEPCQGLDCAHRRHFIRAVEALIRLDRTTIVYVTHRPEEIPRGIHRVLRLRDGRVHGF